MCVWRSWGDNGGKKFGQVLFIQHTSSPLALIFVLFPSQLLLGGNAEPVPGKEYVHMLGIVEKEGKV